MAALDPSPIVRLNQAVALRHLRGAAAALTVVDTLAGQLARYHLFYAVRAWLLRELGRGAEAQVADARALTLTRNPGERRLIVARLALYAAAIARLAEVRPAAGRLAMLGQGDDLYRSEIAVPRIAGFCRQMVARNTRF